MTIAEKLANIANDVGYTGIVPNGYDELVKAFRLQHFSRCPFCDQKTLTGFRTDEKVSINCECGKSADISTFDILDYLRNNKTIALSDVICLLITEKFNERLPTP